MLKDDVRWATPSISALDFTRGLEDLERLRAVRLSNGVPAEPAVLCSNGVWLGP